MYCSCKLMRINITKNRIILFVCLCRAQEVMLGALVSGFIYYLAGAVLYMYYYDKLMRINITKEIA